MFCLTNTSFSVPITPNYGRPRALVRLALVMSALVLTSCTESSTVSLVTMEAGVTSSGCTDPKTCSDPSPQDGCSDPKTCGDPSPQEGSPALCCWPRSAWPPMQNTPSANTWAA